MDLDSDWTVDLEMQVSREMREETTRAKGLEVVKAQCRKEREGNRKVGRVLVLTQV
jgi:hypothetical protein